MASLSSYDVGKKCFEGRSYKADIMSTREGMTRLVAPMREYNAAQEAAGLMPYRPWMKLLLGNHEDRINRAVESDRKLDGWISVDDLQYESFGWTVYPFLEIVNIEGVEFSHYFTTGVMGRPVTSAKALLNARQCSAIMGHVQHTDIAVHPKTQNTAMFVGTCLTPDSKVLTSDLRYVPLGSLKPGDKLVSFDEESVDGKRSRRYREGTVVAAKPGKAELFEVVLSDGTVFRATADHRWLARRGSNYRWTETKDLGVGSTVPRLLPTWQENTSYAAGWLSGMYDGEGCLYVRRTTGGAVAQLSLSQKEGPTLDLVRERLASEVGVSSRTETYDRSASTLRVRGGAREIARVLGTLRPNRLLAKFSPTALGRVSSRENVKVVSITPIGEGDIVYIDIDHGTMIVEGFGHHNCYLHDEDYLGLQGNNCRRQVVVMHEVIDGKFDHMLVSLNFLERRYGS